MSDSIARLAVVITGDASPLGIATRQATGYVKKFEVETTGSLVQVGQSAKAMNAVFGVASGNLGKLTALGALGPTAGLLVAVAAAGKLAFNIAAASDALEVAAGGNTLDTWAGQWDRVQKASTSIAQSIGRPASEMLTRETQQMADIMLFIADRIMPDQVRQEREKLALLEQQKKAVEARAIVEEKVRKEWEAFAKAVGEAENKAGLKMNSRAESLRESLRTPREELVGALAEAQMLFDRGFISAQTYERAALQAGRAFADANRMGDRMEQRETAATPLVSAASRWTSEGFSALQEARQAAQRQAEIERQQLEAQREANKILEEVRDELTDAGLSKAEAAIVVEEVSW